MLTHPHVSSPRYREHPPYGYNSQYEVIMFSSKTLPQHFCAAFSVSPSHSSQAFRYFLTSFILDENLKV